MSLNITTKSSKSYLYQFYTDLEESNKMDKVPFLVVNLLSLEDNVIPYLQKFEKSSFSIDNVIEKANELKYNDQIKQILYKQLTEPDDSFVAYVISDIYSGRKTQRVIEDFRPLVKRAFAQIVNDKANERLKSAMDTEMAEEPQDKKVVTPQPIEVNSAQPSIERLEVFFMIKAFLYDSLNGRRLTYKDADKQLGIFLDDESGKWLCRIDYEANLFYINLQSGDKEYIKRQFRSIDNIYSFKNLLCQAVKNTVAEN